MTHRVPTAHKALLDEVERRVRRLLRVDAGEMPVLNQRVKESRWEQLEARFGKKAHVAAIRFRATDTGTEYKIFVAYNRNRADPNRLMSLHEDTLMALVADGPARPTLAPPDRPWRGLGIEARLLEQEPGFEDRLARAFQCYVRAQRLLVGRE